MKKKIKMLITEVLAILLLCSVFCLSVSAAGSTAVAFNNTSPKVGDSITVTVKLNAGEAVYAVDGKITYDSSVLQYVSGADSASGSTLRIVKDADGASSYSYSISFKTIAEGTANVSFSANYVGASLTSIAASGSSAKITVKNQVVVSSKPVAPAIPSSNCNLSSLSVEGGTLNPAFSQNVTEYSVMVENSVSSTNIKYGKAHSGATVAGGGNVALEVGDNLHTLTVTAQDGSKKTYTLKIHRATVEETVALNPLALVIDGKIHHIVNDFTGIEVPAGFKASTETYNGQEIPVFKSENTEFDYTLFRISRAEDGFTDYYIYKPWRDEFSMLQYMTVNNIMYIFASLPEVYTAPDGYRETSTTLGNSTIRAFCSKDETLADLYVVYCYMGGSEDFYRFDAVQSTVQRAPDFSLTPKAEPVKETGIAAMIGGMTRLEKILSVSLCITVSTVIALIIALIVVLNRRYNKHFEDPLDDEDFLNLLSAPTPDMGTESVASSDSATATKE